MNFTATIKKEILNKQIKDKHCKKAFIAGLFRGTGELYEKDGELGLDVRVADEETAMLVTGIVRSLFDYEIREVSVSEDRLNKKDKFVLSIFGERTIEILESLDVIREIDDEYQVNLNLYGNVNKKECCFKSFIRGLFLATGSCIVPTSSDSSTTGYHLEMVFSHYKPAQDTCDKLAEYGVSSRVTDRRDRHIVYIKSAEEIKDFIAFLPAPVAVLKLTDLMINREIVNYSNRRKNCDLGNVNKQVEAAGKQVSAIDKIEKTVGLSTLKADLYRTAVARKENPEETLSELAERLGISKSCLNHRLRKLVQIASEI